MRDAAPAAAASTGLLSVLKHVARNRMRPRKGTERELLLAWFVEWRDKMERQSLYKQAMYYALGAKNQGLLHQHDEARKWVKWADDLIARAVKGDDTAFDEIHRRYGLYKKTYSVAKRVREAKYKHHIDTRETRDALHEEDALERQAAVVTRKRKWMDMANCKGLR